MRISDWSSDVCSSDLTSFFVPGGPTGAGWTLYPPQAILEGTPGNQYGIILMLVSLAVFVVAFTMGGLNYVTTVLQGRTRGMTLKIGGASCRERVGQYV